MRIVAAKLSCAVGLLLACSWSIGANAIVSAGITPSNPDGTGMLITEDLETHLELNPERTPIETEAGYTSITSVKVDALVSEIRGFASYELDQDKIYLTIADVGGSSAFGSLTLNSSLQGPPGTTPVNVTAEFGFNGSFQINNGEPTLFLGGYLSAGTFSSSTIGGTMYDASLEFLSSAANSSAQPVEIGTGSSETSLFGGGSSSSYSGASFDVQSAQLDNLDAILRLTFPMKVNDNLLIFGSMIGIAGAQPDPLNNDEDLLDGVGVLAASGAVDYSHTARLKIYIPQGYSLTGDDPLLSSAVFTTPVPTPPQLLQILAGLSVLGLACLHRRKLRT